MARFLRFYYLKADRLVEKIKALPMKASMMKKIYKRLDVLKDSMTEFSVNDEKLTVSLPEKVKDIQNKWKKDAAEIANIVKEQAAEERKRKEEERRKADEARLKAEAEAKAKRKEELRKYKEAHKKWENGCAYINAKRSAFVDAKIAEEKAFIINAAAKKRDDTIAKANAILKAQTECRALAESTLASLGMFKFSEKKTQKSIIEETTKLIIDAQASIADAEALYTAEMGRAEKKAENKRNSFQEDAEQAFPLPVEPKKPD